MRKKILITSALPYANGPLHFGHIAGAYLPGDCYARFQRLQQNDVLYICGSDEYGIAITLSADIAGRTPREQVDLFHAINKEFFKKLNFSFDHFSRTTWQGHQLPTQQFFKDLIQNGYIEERTTDQLYSEADGRFLADRYVTGTCPKCGYDKARGDECPECGASYEATDLKNPRSKLTGSPLILKATKHWFLLLDKFKERLHTWLEDKHWKPNVVNFVKGYIDNLHPRAITRDSTWGIPIPLPNTENKVLYVWFDAPIGYISATQEWAIQRGTPDEWKRYWLDDTTKLVQFIGKDNIPFHATIFPAMIMGQNQPYKLVDELPANEFYRLEGRQFSKSDGWTIDLEDFFTRYTPDQIRYAIAANAPETADSEFTWRDFQVRCNSELLGKLGNFINRTLVFVKTHCNGSIPPAHDLQPIDTQFQQDVRSLIDQAAECYERYSLRRACQTIMELAQLGNVYFDAKQPWKDVKAAETRARMETTISCCINCIKALALICSPIIPDTAERIWQMLGYPTDLQGGGTWDRIASTPAPEGQKLPEPAILFQRIEDEQIEAEVAKLRAMSQRAAQSQSQPPSAPARQAVESPEPQKTPISIDEVDKLDLRVAKILKAEPVPKSKKLLKLEVDLGFEKRVVVSGISQHYQPEQLIGKSVVVVANLKPSKLMGIESHGMVLAGSDGTALELVTLAQLPPGSIVS